MDELKIPFTIENIDIDRLYSADEIFITSTSKLIMPIVKIENRLIGAGIPGKLTEKIYNAYKNLLE
jgi:branched-subunit amino acid aminotransferase/4-amino-4-deoxychorismate lyase